MSNILIPLPKINTEISIAGVWIEQRNAMINAAREIQEVKKETDFKNAGDLIQKITKLSNGLEKIRKELSDPFAEAQKIIKRTADEAREILESEKQRLQGMAGTFHLQEIQRIEAAKMEAERKQHEEVERQFAEQEALKEAGLIADEKPFVPEITTPQVVEKAPVSHAIRMAENLTHIVIDEDLIPAVFKTFDERKLNAWKRTHKDTVIKKLKENPDHAEGFIDGIKFEIELKPIGR